MTATAFAGIYQQFFTGLELHKTQERLRKYYIGIENFRI